MSAGRDILEIRPPKSHGQTLAEKATSVYMSHTKSGFPKGMKKGEGVKTRNVNWRVTDEQIKSWWQRAKDEGRSLSQLGEIGFELACQTELGTLRSLLGVPDPVDEEVQNK